MRTAILALALLATWVARPIETRAQACSGSYVKNRQVLYPLGGPAGQPNSGLIATNRYCCANGESISACQGNQDGGPCPNYIEIFTDTFNCNDQLTSSGKSGIVGYIHRICACSGSGPNDPGALNRFPDGQFVSSSCNSNETCDSDEKMCMGTESPLSGGVDEACGDDEHGCSRSLGTDPFPVNLSSGRVETHPITLFSLPTPEGIELDVTLRYNSHFNPLPAQKRSGDSQPTIHSADEYLHYYGRGWSDSFSDRLLISARNLVGARTWLSSNGVITFKNESGTWKSTAGKFELVDRGSNPDGFGRWLIQTTDTASPRRMWFFEEQQLTTPAGSTEVIGRLRRRALRDVSSSSMAGYFGFTLDWASDGTLATVTDTFGRQLSFSYASVSCGTGCVRKSVGGVSYRPAATASLETVATMTYGYAGEILERVSSAALPTGYTRFLYWSPTTPCVQCGRLLTDVIVASTNTDSPAQFSPAQPGEVTLEHHEFELPTGTSNARPRVIASSGPGRSFVYQWDDASGIATQFDLNQPLGACSSGCTTGSACLASTCYVAQQLRWDTGLRQPTGNQPFGAASIFGSGHARSLDLVYSDGATGRPGAPRRSTDTANIKTTNGFDSMGRLRCIVRGDNDDEAFATPGSPDTSACAGPATAQIVRVDYAGLTITKTTPGLLGTTVTEVTTLSASTLLPVSVAITGTTRNIDGSPVVVTRTSTRSYDAFGRLVETNGPLPDGTALDKTTYAYHTVFNAAKPHDFGRLASVTRYVGTSSSSIALTTTYSDYDRHGAPGKITQPSGESVVVAPTVPTVRTDWTIQQVAAGGTVIGTSTVTLNRDGTVRSAKAADGVCLTYQYTGSNGFVGVPTAIRRGNVSDNQCGVVPINTASGEVEVRTYVSGEADRLQSITRYFNGVSQFSYSGFTYDRDRRLVAASTLDSATPFTFGFTDVLPSSTVAPGAPASGSWRTDTTADDFGRPTSLARFITAANKQTYTYSYASPFSPRPTQLARGFNGSSTSITTFVYDDFGRLVETVVPESGPPGSPSPTRYEYDVADRLLKKRVGVGSAAVRTSVYSYDSLGRTLAVDHDTEHPVSCASAPEGTAIQDEEYRYDSCNGDVPAGFACANALGRLTISRAVLQCSSGQVVKRGRWFDYDAAGRLSRVAYATVTGTTIGAPAISTSTYSNANRLLSVTNPITAVYGTAYTPDPASGRPTALTTSAATPAPIASNLTYRAFGALTGLDTPVAQPISGGGTRTLQLRATYRTDDALATLSWRLKAPAGVSDILLLSQTMAYGPAGLLRQRTDAADIASSRYYGYDALLRLTCEARGLAGTSVQPSASDCVTSSTRLAGLFTYGNGQSATSPPDVRLTAFIKNAGAAGASYTSPSLETYTYSSGSGQTQQINRTGSSIVLGHDLLGRRTFDYDSTQPTSSRRDYTYLPNGQLGSIAGTATDGAYTISIRYDEEGHPVTVSRTANGSVTETQELFWDDAHRLVGAIVVTGSTSQRWHYHYLGNTLIAGTRHVVGGGGNQVKRFWMVSDERGLPYRWLDEQGATFWQARWDASSWITIVGVPQSHTWTAFARLGQLRIPGTGASSGSTAARAELLTNRYRVVDPVLGAFVSPDPMDAMGESIPEGYAYARHSAVVLVDADGNRSFASWELPRPSFVDCSAAETIQLRNAIDDAWAAIVTCYKGECGGPGGHSLAREWMHRLSSMRITCAKKGFRLKDSTSEYVINAEFQVFSEIASGAGTAKLVGAFGIPQDPVVTDYYFPPYHFEDPSKKVLRWIPCLSKEVAHEALHIAIKWVVRPGGTLRSIILQDRNNHRDPNEREESWIEKTVDDCISC